MSTALVSTPFTLAPPYHPTTFLDRGVAVPFTTPLLAGTRVRPGAREGLDLLVPNPSGGRGHYVLPWSAVDQICRPTLHDRRLQDRVVSVRGVTPAAIRRAAQEVAAEGFAGREAKAAVQRMQACRNETRLLVNFQLLLALVRHAEPAGLEAIPPEKERPADLERRARRAVARVAPRLNLEAAHVAATLEELAALFAGIGIGAESSRAPMPNLLSRLLALRHDMEIWAARAEDESGRMAELLRSGADLTAQCTAATLTEARGLAANPLELLVRWRSDPETVASKVARPEWLLDGWETISLLWQDASGPAAQRAALGEMAHLVPIIPKEAGDWVGQSIAADSAMVFRRMVELNYDWRTGAHMLDLIVRNEHLRALAA